MLAKKKRSSIALVLGGYVNGYSIIKELYEQDIKDIALFDSGRSLARFSNKVAYYAKVDSTTEGLLYEIKALHKIYSYIIIYPTDDLQLENLHVLYDSIVGFCYLPFNRQVIVESLDKFHQYHICEKVEVPYPKTIAVKEIACLDNIGSLTFPLLIKPSTRKDLTTGVFRTLYLEGVEEYQNERGGLICFIQNGMEFIISEYIPGDDTNIYAYTCFRSNEGVILNEWTGKKLTQYPNNYGVFCSSSNEAPVEVLIQGRALVEALNSYGIIEPEFKLDYRDGKFKLMEVNLRSMMWHRTGSISGVKLHETQYNYATNKTVITYQQEKHTRIHFVFMIHELGNLIARKGYWKYFRYNVFGGDERVWAVFEWRDIKPFFYSLILLVKKGGSACLKRFDLR